MERITCFVCGRNFSVIIIRRHEHACFSHWRKNNFQLPIVYQKAKPEKPNGVNFCSRESDSHYNNAARASSLKCRLPQYVLAAQNPIASSAKIERIIHNTLEHIDIAYMKGNESKLFPRMYSSKERFTLSHAVLSKPTTRNDNFLNYLGVHYRAQGWTSDLIRDPSTCESTPMKFPEASQDKAIPDRFIEIPNLDKRKFPVDKSLLKYDQNYDAYARIHFPWERTICQRML